MCKKLNFVYMIDRMKYQYFDSITGANEKRENFYIAKAVEALEKEERESGEKFCGWKILQPRPLSTFPKFSIGIARKRSSGSDCVNVGRK